MALEYTTVVAVDGQNGKNTVRDLKLVWQTWRLLKPELFHHPMVVIYDAQEADRTTWLHRLAFLREHPDLRVIGWDWPNRDDSELAAMDQRERMLTAFVKVPPAVVETAFWLKLDCDTVAFAPGGFVEESWDRDYPTLIAPGWGYTKPATLPGILDRWAATVPELAPFRAMNLPEPGPGQETIKTRRITSWLMFISTAFSKLVADFCPGRLPVPSQDTLHWYVAWRRGDAIIRHPFKQMGWQHASTRRHRRQLVADVLAQYQSPEGCCGQS